jgi:hypothetical protein
MRRLPFNRPRGGCLQTHKPSSVRYALPMRFLRNMAKKVLPDRFVHWYRRRRATRRYVEVLGHEIYDRQNNVELNELEGRLAARRQGFFDRLVRDVLERSELFVQELDRRIEAESIRHGQQLRSMQEELERLRAEVSDLRARVDGGIAPPVRVPAAPDSGSSRRVGSDL